MFSSHACVSRRSSRKIREGGFTRADGTFAALAHSLSSSRGGFHSTLLDSVKPPASHMLCVFDVRGRLHKTGAGAAVTAPAPYQAGTSPGHASRQNPHRITVPPFPQSPCNRPVPSHRWPRHTSRCIPSSSRTHTRSPLKRGPLRCPGFQSPVCRLQHQDHNS